MFTIRRILDDATPSSRTAIARAQEILRLQFKGVKDEEILRLPDKLRDPLKYRFRSILLVAESSRGRTLGFALLMHAADLRFAYLDYISTAPGTTGRGIGGALYERVREEAAALNVTGLFFECLPDEEALSRDPAIRKLNADRLRFYERYGARPVDGTEYATPLKPEAGNPPYLVLDGLDQNRPLRRKEARAIVRALLERKYGAACPTEYVQRVVDSFRDDPVRLRPFRYLKGDPPRSGAAQRGAERIALVVTGKHAIHHVRERGYVQSPVRIDAVVKEIEPTGLFRRVPPRHFALNHITAVHRREFVSYLKRACAAVPAGESVYPYIFPIRNVARPPKDLPLRAGYYCIDTFTPLNRHAWVAALAAVDCALTAAESILRGERLAYALVRPPGHHAERNAYGGFCYFNSSAIAAHYLSRQGPVAVIDVDYHHGNGTQDIFYQRRDVLTVSIHGHPRHSYPYFSGFDDERGEGPGRGYNLNLPLPEDIGGEAYRAALTKALRRIRYFRPRFLVIALGLDTAKGDPTGSWMLSARDFTANGRMLGSLRLPTLVVQEGGYRTRSLGVNARHFFQGLAEAAMGEPAPSPAPGPAQGPRSSAAAEAHETSFRTLVKVPSP